MSTLKGNEKNNILKGEEEDDEIYGYAGADKLYGYDGDDVIYGGNGADKLFGGFGSDTLYGGHDADLFVYENKSDSGVGGPDVIKDFDNNFDMLDLHLVDANSTNQTKDDPGGADQFFNPPNNAFNNVPGELIIGNGRVEGDIDGNGMPDFVIKFGPAAELPTTANIDW